MVEKSLFIFGLGFAAQAVAKAAMAQGFKVAGTTRSVEKCKELQAQGIDAKLFSEVTAETIAGYEYILSSIAPQEKGDVVVPLLPRNAKWLGYFSTTGVYGDYGGEWVDETSELRAGSTRLLRRLVAEAQWLVRGGQIFRLAGIYGPVRSVLDDIRAGKARRIDKPGQFFSRIHVDDIAQVVLASMAKPKPLSIYNVCDDEPASAAEVVEFGCKLLGVEVLRLVAFEKAELSAMAREFYSANRRVSNRKIKEDLGIKLFYPTYREGLSSLNL